MSIEKNELMNTHVYKWLWDSTFFRSPIPTTINFVTW